MAIEITEAFSGWPEGEERAFTVGERPADLTREYEALLVQKGHARRISGRSAGAAARPDDAADG